MLTVRSTLILTVRRQSGAAVAKVTGADGGQQSTSLDSREIKIPIRIKRGPTEILRALASTVGEDETAFPYKYHDDPRLLPTSAMSKRVYSMSKEAGRKAARYKKYMVTKFPTLFLYDQDEPRLDAFRPKGRPVVETDDVVSEDLLLDRIKRRWVANTIILYERLTQEGQKISASTKLKLLELLCYHNSTQPTSESEWEEETFFRSYFVQNAPPDAAKWKVDGAAMKLFQEIEPKDGRAFAAVVCGTAKFGAFEESRSLYEQMKAAGMKPDLNVFNAQIQCATSTKKAPVDEWRDVCDIFATMQALGVRPNVRSFNMAMLALVRNLRRWPEAKSLCMECFREMISLNIEPSLASLYCVVAAHQQSDELGSYVDAVLTWLENRKLQRVTKEDDLFFPFVMELVADRLQSKTLAHRLHGVLKQHAGENQTLFLNDSMSETRYYDFYVKILSRTEEASKFMQLYGALVPQVYTPDERTLAEIVANLELTGSQQYLPQIYYSAACMGYAFKFNVVVSLLSAMHRAENVDFATLERFAEAANDLADKIDQQFRPCITREGKNMAPFRIFKWNSKLVMYVALLNARAGKFDQAYSIFSKLIPPKKENDKRAMIEKGQLPDQPAPPPLVNEYVRLCFTSGNLRECYVALKYMFDSGMTTDARRWVDSVMKSAKVTAPEKNLFSALLQRRPTAPAPFPQRPLVANMRQQASAANVQRQTSTDSARRMSSDPFDQLGNVGPLDGSKTPQKTNKPKKPKDKDSDSDSESSDDD